MSQPFLQTFDLPAHKLLFAPTHPSPSRQGNMPRCIQKPFSTIIRNIVTYLFSKNQRITILVITDITSLFDTIKPRRLPTFRSTHKHLWSSTHEGSRILVHAQGILREIRTIDLFVLTSSDQLPFILKVNMCLVCKTSNLKKEVNCTEPSASVRVPCHICSPQLSQHVLLKIKIFATLQNKLYWQKLIGLRGRKN